MKFKLLAGAAMAAVFAATGASAQVGWYGAVDLGYHWPDGIETHSSEQSPPTASPYTWDFNQEDDWAGFARLGYQLTDHWRVELEVGYRAGDIELGPRRHQPGRSSASAPPAWSARPAGPDLRLAGRRRSSPGPLMGNVIYDILPGLRRSIRSSAPASASTTSR